MTQETFSAAWSAIAPALGDHLWQSTLFAAAAGLLTLALRKNHARTRYLLWLIASLKFLIPFSWLVALGSRFSWRGTAWPVPVTYSVVEQISQPFTQPATPAIARMTIASAAMAHVLPAVVFAIWLCGSLAVLLTWLLRWGKVSTAIRSSVPLRDGREVEALRRQERIAGIRRSVELLLSRATLEPGIFGVSRPVLVWPEGISAHLDAPHLEAILAHELWHVRRRDNLAAALHMMVEAIFWFHPLVWWMGARLVDERERACDEQVLEFGSERHIYAESILKVCEFCVGSPLPCVAGVTGADLKKRMVHIMSEHVARKLDLRRKLLLTVAAALAIAVPIVTGAASATPARPQSQPDSAVAPSAAFDKASITPSVDLAQMPAYAGQKTHIVRMMFGQDGFFANGVTLRSVIEEAYGVQDNQIVGGPAWLNSATFDIQANIDNSDSAKSGFPPDRRKFQKMLRTLLAERAKLTLHTESRELPSYELVVAEGGPTLQASSPDDALALPDPAPGTGKSFFLRTVQVGSDGQPLRMHGMRMQMDQGQVVGMAAQGVSTADFASQLSRQIGAAVVDKTGLTGTYNFNLQWKHSDDETAGSTDNPSAENSGSSSSLLTAIQEQLGLKLEPHQGPTQVLVIDHIEKPAEN